MTADLILTPNMERPDDIYAGLLATHEGLTKDASDALNARLILILMNHIGQHDVLAQALQAAKSPEKG